MSFQNVNVTSLLGQMSPEKLSLALHTGEIVLQTLASGASAVTTVRAPLPRKLARVIARVDGVFGTAETLTVSLRYMNSAGVETSIAIGVLNLTTAPAAGEFILAEDIDTGNLAIGDSLELVHVYVAGTPNAPTTVLQVQLY